MAFPSRTSQFSKVQKVLKKLYNPVTPDPNRPVFEHLLYACCLENAHYEVAEEAFAALVHNFFDWNEVRVSTLRELSEVMAGLPEPPAAANRLKRVLQSIFESTYSFGLEELRKLNLGPAADQLRKMDGTTNFGVAYVIQSALGGHAIPVDLGVLRAMCVVELVSEEAVKAGAVPGLERAVAKSKGIEFGSQLHQFGADFIANPYAPALHETLLQINPDCRDRLPKRRTRRQIEAAAARRKKRRADRRKARQERAQEARAEAEAAAAQQKKKKTGRKKKADEAKLTRGKETAAEEQATTPRQKEKPAQEKPAAAPKKKPAATGKKTTGKGKAAAGKELPPADAGAKKSPASGLSKRKPR